MDEVTLGVYIIKNKINDKVYIGSSIHIERRWFEHKNTLNKNKHHNYHLQKAWNKYGEDNFLFEILEIVSDEDKLIEREQYWMDKYKCYDMEKGYNINPTAGSQLGRKNSEESKLRMIKANHPKEVVQIDMKGNFVNEFLSILHAVRETKISETSIVKSLKNKTFFKGYAWIEKSDYLSNNYDINEFTLIKNGTKEVARIELNGDITIFKSTNEAGKVLHLNCKIIKKCCEGERKYYRLCEWKYVTDL